MARIDTLSNFLTDVADAIRSKTGDSSTITPADFDTEIENIPSGGGGDTSTEELMRISDLTLKLSTAPQLIMSDRNYAQSEVDKVDTLINYYDNIYKGGN